jgi:N4-gp56 family major capsid protein
MAQTTTTTLEAWVPSELISADILQETRPNIVVAGLIQREFLGAGQGKVWEQTQLPTTTAAGVDEDADLAAVARTPATTASITIGEVGLSTEVTDLALETAILNDLSVWARSSGRAIAQKVDGDLCSLLAGLNSSGSGAVGTSGADLTVANFIEAIYTLELANAPGQKVCVLHPVQKMDLFNALTDASNGAAVFTNLPELVREGRLPEGLTTNGFWGVFCGVPIYVTTEVDTANTGADRAGAMFVREALTLVQLRPLRVEYQRDASARSTEVVATIAYGIGENIDTFGVPIITDA